MILRSQRFTLFPYTTLFRSGSSGIAAPVERAFFPDVDIPDREREREHHHLRVARPAERSEEHTSELQSHSDLVCRLLLEKKKESHKIYDNNHSESFRE